ncbi:AtpZ/AtpI family protein [Helicobacter muridarum]|uniref:Membrane protein n=2 Tax=Helicobacter muridarum TaxID=216 RepID=A0A377PV14_9HELI|nr:AtpZ/AtpI family protein [Helicobacter muridarum]STQ86417.1 membrane protein [Helicobacter muridarum]
MQVDNYKMVHKDKTDDKDKQNIQSDNMQQNKEQNKQTIQEGNYKQESMISSNEYYDNENKIRQITKGANDLSLGISMVIAVLIGLGLGYGLYKITGYYWLVWIGLGYGVAAAILNVIKAYKRLQKDLNSIKNNEKYQYMLEIQKEQEKEDKKQKI